MTTMTAPGEQSGDAPVREVLPGPVQRSVLAGRARALLVGGMVGAHLLALPVIVTAAVLDGARGAVSAALGAALALLFYTFGQAVQVRFAGASATTLMAASLASFGVRAGLLAAAFTGWLNLDPAAQSRLAPAALAAGVGAGVIGWLLGLARAYSRLRILAFDEPEPAPSDAGVGAR